MKSSDISAKYSWPNSEQNDEIHDSGVPDEEDIVWAVGGAGLKTKGNFQTAQG